MQHQLQGNYIKKLHYYEEYLPNQTFKFKYLDDAYDKISKIWNNCRFKGLLLEISFKAIIEEFEDDKPVRISKTRYEYTYGFVRPTKPKEIEIKITDWDSIINTE